MKSHSFQIELLGGPADGLRVAADSVPGRTIQMSSGPSARRGDRLGDPKSPGTHLAEYEMLWSKYATDPGGLPIVHMSYDFVGSRAVRRTWPAKYFGDGLLRMARLAVLKRWAGGLRRWLAPRLTADVDYPLSTRARRSKAPRQRIKKS